MVTIEIAEINTVLIEELSKYYTVMISECHGTVKLELYNKHEEDNCYNENRDYFAFLDYLTKQ